MKNILLLASAVSFITLTANAQYYGQPTSNAVQYQPSYQSQPQSVSTNFYLKPYIGLDYSYNIIDLGNDEDGDSLDSYVADKLHAGAISLGVQVHDIFSLEAFYKKSAKAKKSNSSLFVVPVKTEFELQSFGVDAIFHSPRFGYDNRIELLGSVGVAWYEVKLKMNALGHSESGKDSHVGFRAGAGLQYYLQDNLALRLMGRYNYTGIEDAENMFELTAGVRFYF